MYRTAVNVESVQVKGGNFIAINQQREISCFIPCVNVSEQHHGLTGSCGIKSSLQGAVIIGPDLRHPPLGIKGRITGRRDLGLICVKLTGTVCHGVPAGKGKRSIRESILIQLYGLIDGTWLRIHRSRSAVIAEGNGTCACIDDLRLAISIQFHGITRAFTFEIEIAAFAGDDHPDAVFCDLEGCGIGQSAADGDRFISVQIEVVPRIFCAVFIDPGASGQIESNVRIVKNKHAAAIVSSTIFVDPTAGKIESPRGSIHPSAVLGVVFGDRAAGHGEIASVYEHPSAVISSFI